jgi:hypothetical protein
MKLINTYFLLSILILNGLADLANISLWPTVFNFVISVVKFTPFSQPAYFHAKPIICLLLYKANQRFYILAISRRGAKNVLVLNYAKRRKADNVFIAFEV